MLRDLTYPVKHLKLSRHDLFSEDLILYMIYYFHTRMSPQRCGGAGGSAISSNPQSLDVSAGRRVEDLSFPFFGFDRGGEGDGEGSGSGSSCRDAASKARDKALRGQNYSLHKNLIWDLDSLNLRAPMQTPVLARGFKVHKDLR